MGTRPKATELPERAPIKVRATERRHNKSRRKRGPEKRGRLTPDYETIKFDSSLSHKCSRCGTDIKRGTRLCDGILYPCSLAVSRIQWALRKFPPLPRVGYRKVARNDARF